MVLNPVVNNKVNYQPQLVTAGFQPINSSDIVGGVVELDSESAELMIFHQTNIMKYQTLEVVFASGFGWWGDENFHKPYM